MKTYPQPGELMKQAEQEKPRKRAVDLEPYWPAIATLKAKRFTLREIVKWLRARGLEASHTQIWRLEQRKLKELPEQNRVDAGESLRQKRGQ